jgi:hypothetical protein
MTTLDVLILIPLIPAIPVFITWWLPWEQWIPARLPKLVLGPYLLYVAFGIWHFGLGSWVAAIFLLFGIGLTAFAVLERAGNQ